MFDWILSRKLDRIGRRANPDRAFVLALEKRLRQEGPKQTAFWKVAMASVTSAGVLFLGTGTYAYASENVLPDHPLYGVRQTIERAESALAFTPTLKARVGVQLMSRRLREEEVIAKRQKPVTDVQVRRFIDQAEIAIEASRLADQRVGERLDAVIAALEKEHALLLGRLQQEGVDSEERLRLETLLNHQTEKLQARIRLMPEARQIAYRDLLERKLLTIRLSPKDAARVEEILKELENAYVEITAHLEAEAQNASAADDLAGKHIDVSDIVDRSVVDEE